MSLYYISKNENKTKAEYFLKGNTRYRNDITLIITLIINRTFISLSQV